MKKVGSLTLAIALLLPTLAFAKGSSYVENQSYAIKSNVVLYKDAPRTLIQDNFYGFKQWALSKDGNLLICVQRNRSDKCEKWYYLESTLPANAVVYTVEFQTMSDRERIIVRYNVK